MLTALSFLAIAQTTSVVAIKPSGFTAAVGTDADDPAVWVHPKNPSLSRIYGTDKTEAPAGGIYAFDLKGRIVQRIEGIDRPNNVDVAYELSTPNGTIDLAVATERKKRRLLVYRIDRKDGKLSDITGKTEVFAGEPGEDGAPMGIATWRRADGKLYAFITPKAGPVKNHIAQYELVWNAASKKVDIKLVRRFGDYGGVKETESIAVDAKAGIVYYSDETVGNRAYWADPKKADAASELDFFNRTGTTGDHEGIAIVHKGEKTYVICTDQIPANSHYRVFLRTKANGKFSHQLVGAFSLGADETDGLEIIARPLGPNYPGGIVIAMDSTPKRFVLARWDVVERALKL